MYHVLPLMLCFYCPSPSLCLDLHTPWCLGGHTLMEKLPCDAWVCPGLSAGSVLPGVHIVMQSTNNALLNISLSLSDTGVCTGFTSICHACHHYTSIWAHASAVVHLLAPLSPRRGFRDGGVWHCAGSCLSWCFTRATCFCLCRHTLTVLGWESEVKGPSLHCRGCRTSLTLQPSFAGAPGGAGAWHSHDPRLAIPQVPTPWGSHWAPGGQQSCSSDEASPHLEAPLTSSP